MSSSRSITANLKREAHRVGFELVGVCAAATPSGWNSFQQWLSSGYAGQMKYLIDRRAAYEHPRNVLEGVRSLVMLGMNYRTAEPCHPDAGQGRISRYAWGDDDYHDVIHARLKELAAWLRTASPKCQVRGVVDTAPLLEREFAQVAGLGWIGKNTMLLNQHIGSWFFLAALLTDLELEYDSPEATDHCGSCRACLDACPTEAFTKPYVLDATRCISYLTIELREAIPPDLREGMGDWLFGCDICQDVCPWNRRAPISLEKAHRPSSDSDAIDLVPLFSLSDDAFRQRFRRTPLWRARRRGVLRNAAIVLGNQRSVNAIDALARGLNDVEPLVRGACAWALGQYDDSRAKEALARRQCAEQDDVVRWEIEQAFM